MAGTDRARDTSGLGPAPVVVLARTQLGENVGTAARAMLNFGLTELRLAAPACGWPNTKALAAASGATLVLNRLTLHDDVTSATADLHYLLATSARPRELIKPVLTMREAAAEMRARVAAGARVGLLFGPERTGLSNDDLLLADAIVTVPLNPGYSSLNVAQAVLLAGYEWFQADSDTPARIDPAAAALRATKGELADLLEHLVTELDAVDFFRTPDRRTSMVRALKATFGRSGPLASEVQLLRGVVKALAGGGHRGRRAGRS
jgi:tRNA/rRNA methyltransferase